MDDDDGVAGGRGADDLQRAGDDHEERHHLIALQEQPLVLSGAPPVPVRRETFNLRIGQHREDVRGGRRERQRLWRGHIC
jgi:hypothetical protein